MKIKIFTMHDGEVIETAVSSWIANSDVDVVDVKLSTSFSDKYDRLYYSAMIVYKEK